MNRKKLFSPILIFAVLLLTTCGTPGHYRDSQLRPYAPVASTTLITNNLEAQKKILDAFAAAYPGKIGSIEFADNDWTMMVNGKRFYYANGRFLPEEIRTHWKRYAPYDFYDYPWVGTEMEKLAGFRFPVYSVGSSFLFDTLYSSHTEEESRDKQVSYSFLGAKIQIHSDIAPLLDNVQRQIRTAARTDPSINAWINELQTEPPTGGWNWRVIAGTQRRSNHSYGIAMDLLPKDLAGRRTYWQWYQNDKNENADYYIPPQAVIQAFQDNGFIWGGNWNLIDTMHFEYRPEILILNGLR